MKIDINDSVKVKLNDFGKEIHRNNWEDFYKRTKQEYIGPKVDADGYSVLQLWCLMREYGPYLSLGSQCPFDTEIEILT
jgi:hypothetical protein